MTSPFSWTDTVQIAFSSCLPCLKPAPPSGDDEAPQDREPYNHNPAINRIPRARPDELQGLLNDHDTDPEAETLSLHSNPGQARRNRKKKRTKKASTQPRRITLFGYDLFGRPTPPPIRLSDDDEALYSSRPPTIATAHSTTSTLDSDAAPLDSSIIATLSSTNAAAAFVDEAAAVEAQRLREKAERRQRRRERKELKRVAQMLAERGVVGDGDEFEGFQGSGGAARTYPRPSNTLSHTTTSRLGSDSGSGSAHSGQREEYGQFVTAPPLQEQGEKQQEEDDDAADLDGGLYSSRNKRRPGGSDSRSRTSTSTSDRVPRNIIKHLQSQSHPEAQPQPPLPSPAPAPKPKKSKSTSASGDSRTTKSHSSTTTSQSPSLASPTSPNFPVHTVSPSTIEQGQGFFDLEDEPASAPPNSNPNPNPHQEVKRQREVPSAGLTRPGFPMTGFGGGGPGGGMGAKRSRDLAAFLARSGEGDRVDGL